jgi:hypothetical protein
MSSRFDASAKVPPPEAMTAPRSGRRLISASRSRAQIGLARSRENRRDVTTLDLLDARVDVLGLPIEPPAQGACDARLARPCKPTR